MDPTLCERRKKDKGLLHSTRFLDTSMIPSAHHGEEEKGCQMRVRGREVWGVVGTLFPRWRSNILYATSKNERENNNNRARDSWECGDGRAGWSRVSRFPSHPNPYGPTQPFRRMHLIQQWRQTTQLLFAVMRTVMRACTGDPVAVGSDRGSRSFRVPLEVSLESLTRVEIGRAHV